jgi:hypothetical protein
MCRVGSANNVVVGSGCVASSKSEDELPLATSGALEPSSLGESCLPVCEWIRLTSLMRRN